MSYDSNKMLSLAQQQIGRLKVNETFNVKKILGDIDYYKDLSKSDKMDFGRFFKNEVTESKVPNVKLTGSKLDGSIEYIKE